MQNIKLFFFVFYVFLSLFPFFLRVSSVMVLISTRWIFLAQTLSRLFLDEEGKGGRRVSDGAWISVRHCTALHPFSLGVLGTD